MKPLHRNAILLCLLLAVFAPTTAHAATYSRAKTRRIVTKAALAYHLTYSERVWLRRAAVDIIYDGAHESGGGTNAGNGSCVGILQYNSGWNANARERRIAKRQHQSDWRRSGTASLFRFVRVYRDGGKPAVARHWKATLGR